MDDHEPRTDTMEEAIIAFMLAFWPLLLTLGIVDHFFLPEYDLRLPTLVLAGAAGLASARQQRRNAERLGVIDDPR
jgi:hypothetical protein